MPSDMLNKIHPKYNSYTQHHHTFLYRLSGLFLLVLFSILIFIFVNKFDSIFTLHRAMWNKNWENVCASCMWYIFLSWYTYVCCVSVLIRQSYIQIYVCCIYIYIYIAWEKCVVNIMLRTGTEFCDASASTNTQHTHTR